MVHNCLKVMILSASENATFTLQLYAFVAMETSGRSFCRFAVMTHRMHR